MKHSILKPKLTINADFVPSETTPKSLRLDLRSHQGLENEQPTPTPRVLTSRLPSYSIKSPSIRELESPGSIDIGLVTPSSQVMPLSNRSASKISVTSPSSPAKNFTSEYFRTASLAISNMKTQDRILNNIPEEPRLPAIDLRPIPSFRTAATERTDRTNDYFVPASDNPTTAQTSRTNRAFYFQTLSSTRGFERIKTEDMEESAYEKNSHIIEKGSKLFKKKVSTLNFAEIRKTSYGTRTFSHDFRNTDSFIPQAPKLRTRQQSQVEINKPDADNIFFLTEKIGQKESPEGSDVENNDPESELIDILENQSNHISLQKSVATYCRISVVDKYSPMSISILGAKNVKRIRSFVSTSNQRPSKVNCDDKYEARNYKLYEKNRATGTARFLNSYFYIALFPNDNGIISIKIEFAQKKPATAMQETTKRIPGKLTSMMKKPGYFPDILADMDKKEMYMEIWRIKRERKQKMLMLSQGVNKIEFNKNTEQYIPSRALEKREMLKEKTESQLRMAQSRKTVIDQEKKGMRKANMMKHDLQKMIKEIASGETKKAMTLKFLLEKWILNIFFCKLGESFKQILRKQRIVKAKRERLVFSLATFKFKMHMALNKKGEFPMHRLRFDIKMALQLHANVIQNTRMHEVGRVVINFLQDNMVIHYLKNKFLNTVQSLKRVQSTFREYLRRKEGFKSCLLLLWDKNYMKIYHECMQTSVAAVTTSNVVAKPVLRKLHTLDLSVIDAARKKFMKTWFKRCLARYKKNYHIHYLEVCNLSHEERQQWHLQIMFMRMEQKEKEVPLIEKLKKASKAGLMEEFKKNNIANIDYSGPDVSHQQKLIVPRLFLLPSPEELNQVIKEVILKQKEAVK